MTVHPMLKDRMRMTLLLGGAIAGAVALAIFGLGKPPGASAEAELPALNAAPTASPPAEVDDTDALAGEVLETIPVSQYTYLRLKTARGDVWAAVPSASIALHSRVQVADANRMDDFKSKTLARTFKVIYFGNLAGGSSSAPATAAAPSLPAVNDDQALPPGHPKIANAALGSVDDDNQTLPPGHPSIDEAGPFGRATNSGPAQLAGPPAAAEPALSAPPSIRASGPHAHLIAEISAQRQQLVGQRVRVRGQVTKVTDLRGQAFFHVRDSSFAADGSAADLVVTSAATPKRGEIATFEGVLRTDVDVGIGFKYPALLENATSVSE